MHRYIIKRLLFLIPTVLGVTLIIYIVMSITPGNPGRMILGPNANAAEVEAMNEELGYNDPVVVRWFNYLKDIVTLAPVFGHFASCHFSSYTIDKHRRPVGYFVSSETEFADGHHPHDDRLFPGCRA